MPASKNPRKSAGQKPGVKVARKRGAPPDEVFTRLHREYPGAHCELDHANPFQLLAATILSAQCTDKRVNMVTPALFARYPTPESLARAEPGEVEAIIRTTGFFRSKAKNLIGMATGLVDRFHGQMPRTIDELITLPGVGRKTANVLLGDAFGIAAGVVVDTHVGRLSRRLGLTKAVDPVKVERDLMRLFPPEHWTLLAHLLIFHGRRVCYARRPQCEHCVLHDICPSSLV
ncbi:MAG TPA: endonuclease III [Gemmatimonadaceae bacterium]|nr:endonuclease III [Gemmatimonadaceae bacterium]